MAEAAAAALAGTAFCNPFRPSWGEPYEHVAARMSGALNAALTVAYGQHAVLVSH